MVTTDKQLTFFPGDLEAKALIPWPLLFRLPQDLEIFSLGITSTFGTFWLLCLPGQETYIWKIQKMGERYSWPPALVLFFSDCLQTTLPQLLSLFLNEWASIIQASPSLLPIYGAPSRPPSLTTLYFPQRNH